MTAVGEELIEVGWTTGQSQYRLVRLAADFADSEEWAEEGYPCPGPWIADNLDVAVRTANAWIHTGRALRGLPRIAEAVSSREISYTKARTLVGVATPDNEAELLDLARRHSAGMLPTALAAWSSRNEPDDVIDRRRQQSRSVTWHTQPDGMVVMTARLPPLQAGAVIAAIEGQVRSGLLDHDRRVDGRWPSLAQQRCDALVGLINGGGATTTTEVVVHVQADGCSMSDGTPVTDNAVMRALPDSFVRALVHDASGTPVNASSKRRHPSSRQKRAVDGHDRRCVDCGSRDLLEYDHDPPYAMTGRTRTDELFLRCAACHRRRHGNGPRSPAA